ncbi:MAG: LysR family transcriptional regulator [Pseudomonadota bacterium]
MSRPSVDSERIVIFEAVMRTGSLSAAARELRMSQPTVRRAIQALEEDLSGSLFTRSVNELVPTSQAHALSPAAKAVVEASYAFERTASHNQGTVTGTVRISASRVVSHFLLPKLIAELCQDLPGLKVELIPDDNNSDLLRRDADVAIRHVAPHQKQLIARKLAPLELGLFAKAVSGKEDLLSCLGAEPFIWEDRDTTLTKAASALDLPKPARIAATTDDQALQILLIEAGVGMGFLQADIAKQRGLRRADPSWSAHLPVWIVAHEDQINNAPIRETFDRLVEELVAP